MPDPSVNLFLEVSLPELMENSSVCEFLKICQILKVFLDARGHSDVQSVEISLGY